MTDPGVTEATTDYYVLRIYRRCSGRQGERSSLAGIIEDTQGNQLSFRDIEELWQVLAGEASLRQC